MAPRTEPPRCSFCNKAQEDVRKLIAGPSAYICDECVDICNNVIGEERKLAAGAADLEVFESRHFGSLVHCRLCQNVFAKEQCIGFPGRGWLCTECVATVHLHLGKTSEPPK